MKFKSSLLLIATLCYVSTSANAATQRKHDKVVACYVAMWAAYRPSKGSFTLNNLEPRYCTHLIYAFAGLDPTNWSIKSLDPWMDLEPGKGNYKKMTALRKLYPDLKITLGIGGWNEGSKNYSDMASDAHSRSKFVNSVLNFMKLYDFDGLDLDWEFPGKRGGNPAKDKKNFALLTKELKENFRSRNLLLTAAISADEGVCDTSYDIPEISKYLDFIHVMAYDYNGAWSKKVLPNAPLHSKNDSSVEKTIKYLLKKGAPAKKLVIGVPFYGRTFNLTSLPHPNNSPIGLESLDQGFAGKYTREAGFMGFNEICEEQLTNPESWNVGWDNSSKTAYAVNGKNVILYDNLNSMTAKLEHIKELDLAGVMVWSIDTDDFLGECAALHKGDSNRPSYTTYPLMKHIDFVLSGSINIFPTKFLILFTNLFLLHRFSLYTVH